MARYLLDNDISIEPQRLRSTFADPLIYFAQRENHGTEVFQLLLKRVADQDNERLRNALGVAIQIDCLEAVQLLLNKRVNINLSVGESVFSTGRRARRPPVAWPGGEGLCGTETAWTGPGLGAGGLDQSGPAWTGLDHAGQPRRSRRSRPIRPVQTNQAGPDQSGRSRPIRPVQAGPGWSSPVQTNQAGPGQLSRLFRPIVNI